MTTIASDQSRDLRRSRTNRLLEEAWDASPVERRRLLDEVIVENIAVARSIAGRYVRRGIASEDLEQVACMALVAAANRYDPTKAEDFLTYAVPTIRGEVKRYFRDHGWAVRPTRSVQETQGLINREVGAAGRDLDAGELAERLSLPVPVIEAALQAQGCFAPTSLDHALASGDSVGDRLVADDASTAYEAAEARVLLRSLTQELEPRDRLILYLRFVEGRTQAEIGTEIGISQMQVSRLLARVLEKMRALSSDASASDVA